jgi:hypothetical protein
MSDPTPIELAELAHIHGGLRFDQGDRQSTNVEDRRTPEGKARDQKWFEDNRDMYSPIGPAQPRPTPTPTLPTQRPPRGP